MDSVGCIGFRNEKVVDEWRTEMKILSLKASQEDKSKLQSEHRYGN